MDLFEIRSYEDIRDSLRVRIMDIKRNAETLKNAVYEPIGCGLAMVAYMEMPEEISANGIANVPRSLAEVMTGTDPKTVLEDAMKGSVSMEYPKLCSIQDMLFAPMIDHEPENYLDGGTAPEGTLLVLTTEEGRLGASALLYPGIQEKIGKIVGGDYYVLPSSIHEVLILPDNGEQTPSELAKMVKTINENEVAPEDRLCNRVLRFHVDTQELTVAADADRRREMER